MTNTARPPPKEKAIIKKNNICSNQINVTNTKQKKTLFDVFIRGSFSKEKNHGENFIFTGVVSKLFLFFLFSAFRKKGSFEKTTHYYFIFAFLNHLLCRSKNHLKKTKYFSIHI